MRHRRETGVRAFGGAFARSARCGQWGCSGRRFALGLACLSLCLVLAFVLGPRNTFGPDRPAWRPPPPSDLTQLDAWLARGEAGFPDLRPGVAKGIVWNGVPGQATEWSVVYVHGYSATRLETAPLADLVARQLGANLFYTRLTGHGRSAEAMGEATVQDWLADTVEAVRIGHLIGRKVLLIGVSTGGTLATWLATHPQTESADAYVFVSPNYGPRNKRSELINGPWGQELALALEGDVRGEASSDPRENLAWTNRHATRALFPMMALVKQVRESDLSRFQAPLLVLYSRRDQTVDPSETQAVFARIGSGQKRLEEVSYSESLGQHVLAGSIRAPRATAPMAARVVDWVRALPSEAASPQNARP